MNGTSTNCVSESIMLTAAKVEIAAGQGAKQPAVNIVAYTGGIMRVGGWGDNVTEDGPQGVEVLRPAMAFSVTYYKSNENVTWDYIQTLYKLVGRINSAPVNITAGGIAMTFAEQELRLDGVSANPRGDKDWELVIRFSASPNMTNLPLPGTQAATVNKKGWDYLWIEHGPVEESGGVRTLQPIGAHVEQVHYLGEFTQI